MRAQIAEWAIRGMEATFKRTNNRLCGGAIAHVRGVILDAEGRHVEAVNELVSAAEQYGALAVGTWLAEAVDDLAALTAIDDESRAQLRQAVAALPAEDMSVSEVLSIFTRRPGPDAAYSRSPGSASSQHAPRCGTPSCAGAGNRFAAMA
jgi:hypothetical protein